MTEQMTEQNGVPHSHPSLVMASYSLQTTNSWLLRAPRVHHHMILKNSEAEVPTA